MANKVTIVGAGSVGATIAYSIVTSGSASEIVLIDIKQDKAYGEAMDIAQGTPYSNPALIYSGDYEDAKNSDIVVITSGVARKSGQSRLDLAQVNVDIMKSIIPNITKAAPEAIYILVNNPVDILTYQFIKTSGIPEHKIMGTGTLLDTSRLRYRLAELYNISQSNIHAYVFGEHGDSLFIPWSIANIAGFNISKFLPETIDDNKKRIDMIDKDKVEDYVRKSGGTIISNKGATYYAVSLAVNRLIKYISKGIDTILPVSHIMKGEYGISDVCLSTLCIVGKNGITGRVNVGLLEEEQKKLIHSADCLKATINQINF